jgi:hypothetical protein
MRGTVTYDNISKVLSPRIEKNLTVAIDHLRRTIACGI